MKPITEVAAGFGIKEENLELYGKYKAKVGDGLYENLRDKPDGKLILVTAVNPTPAGEGKTTVTVGLAQALNRLGRKTMAALREPSLGPCMGVKGGAAGGGYSQVVPMEDINLHFTGDIHAVTSAHNLLSAIIDNHIHQGNELSIDVRQITWKRVMDMNDRALRNVIVGLGGKPDGMPRQDGFMTTVASEIMAILCLAKNLADLKERLGRIIIGYTSGNEPVTAAMLKAHGAMAALLKEAVKPNLVQTLEHTPALIHGGPFANIAHGCNSVRATKLALKLGEFAVTEAGFGADLGAEKFFDIKCRMAGLTPSCAVLVVSARAMKYNGGVPKDKLTVENTGAIVKGIPNLAKHVENLGKFNIPIVVAMNEFPHDTPAEQTVIKTECEKLGVEFALTKVYTQGGKGGTELAEKVIKAAEKRNGSHFAPLYDTSLGIKKKIEKISTEIYGASGVHLTPAAKNEINRINRLGFSGLPVCMAKTQYSLSDDPSLLGRPEGFEITVREVRLSAGAGFIVAVTGDIMTMPGLPKTPSAENIDIDEDGNISGLF